MKIYFKNLISYIICFILFILVIFFLLSRVNDHLKNDLKLNYKYSYYAIPLALSVIKGHEYNYAGYESIKATMPNEVNGLNRNDFNALINKIIVSDQNGENSFNAAGGEDLGLVDFSYFALKIFGNDVNSFIKFYFLILFVSIFLFFIHAYKKVEFYLVTAVYLLTFCISFGNFQYSVDGMIFDRIVDTRNFSMLAVIPLLHLFFYIFILEKKFNLLIVLQLILLNFLCFVRSSLYLELLIIFCIYGLYIVTKNLKKNKTEDLFLINLKKICIIILICLIVLPQMTKLFVSKQQYTKYQLHHHPVTNMFRAGMIADNPTLKEKYNFNFDLINQPNIDKAILDSGLFFYNNYYNKNLNKPQIFFPYGGIDWEENTKLERSFILYLITNHYDELLKNFLYYKPIKIFEGFTYELKIFLNNFKYTLFILLFSFFFFLILITNFKNILLLKVFGISFFVSLPVTLKNLFLWGNINQYFLDLFVIYFNFFFIVTLLIISIVVYHFFKISKKISS
jgi:hypothetical protein